MTLDITMPCHVATETRFRYFRAELGTIASRISSLRVPISNEKTCTIFIRPGDKVFLQFEVYQFSESGIPQALQALSGFQSVVFNFGERRNVVDGTPYGIADGMHYGTVWRPDYCSLEAACKLYCRVLTPRLEHTLGVCSGVIKKEWKDSAGETIVDWSFEFKPRGSSKTERKT